MVFELSSICGVRKGEIMEFDEGIPAEEILQVDLRFAKHLVECAREARRDAEDRVELVETAM